MHNLHQSRYSYFLTDFFIAGHIRSFNRHFQQRVSYSSGSRLRTKECFFCSPTVLCIERTEAALCLDFKVDAVEALNDLDFWDKSAARPGQLELGARWGSCSAATLPSWQ